MYVHFILFYRHLSLPWGLYLRLFITLYVYKHKIFVHILGVLGTFIQHHYHGSIVCVIVFVCNVSFCAWCFSHAVEKSVDWKQKHSQHHFEIVVGGGEEGRGMMLLYTLNILKIISFLLLFQKYVICMDFERYKHFFSLSFYSFFRCMLGLILYS